jgi:hypothetical protein
VDKAIPWQVLEHGFGSLCFASGHPAKLDRLEVGFPILKQFEKLSD